MTDFAHKSISKPNHIADYLLIQSRERGEVLTNLKLQKLLYYAQAWFIVLNRKSLFDEDFEAWIHGPVLPSQYHRFKSYKWMPLIVKPEAPQLDSAVVKHLDETIDVFGSETAVELELMTHSEKPWIDARNGLDASDPSGRKISKKSMLEYYITLYSDEEKERP